MIKDNYTRHSLITRVVDGDTVEAIVDLGYTIKTKQSFRILNINTPEIKGESRLAGLISKDYVVKALENKEVDIISHKTDSFKRWLGEIYYMHETLGQVNIAVELVEQGLAVPYMVDKN